MKEYIRGGLLLLGWLLLLGAAGGMECGTLGFGGAVAAALCGLGCMVGAVIAERRKVYAGSSGKSKRACAKSAESKKRMRSA